MVFDDLPIPSLSDDEILVDMVASGVNYIDTYHRTGLYKLPLPAVLGREGAGTVAAVGKGVTKFRVGDSIAFIAPGSYTEKLVIKEAKGIQVPEGLRLETAAAALLQGLTAHYLTTSSYPIQAGDSVLVHAGAGGTGGLIIQMAKLMGATVYATASTPEKRQMCEDLGADKALPYEGFSEAVREFTDGVGVNAVYDGVGAATAVGSMGCLKKRGYCILFGNASGKAPDIDPLTLTKMGSIFVTRPTLVHHIADPTEKARRCADLFKWINAGQVNVRIAETFPLAEAGKAHDFLESRSALGKVMLDCKSSA
eukprot:CAMPEP_0205822964 /NCGR_PEP_ID=MMETSP0206-20130828/14546_1 /ASSEMBLY_ACC=CAM_ASM_000279 /TAXON_ID=36767 /ORGANISM="Euplotes focardii, Strain TN1" /LENGTH=309 /DNA_ID=CAMNT_0053119679 /DNA_START=273 /DNA_END=1202 /DNA_ORIENTATION=-